MQLVASHILLFIKALTERFTTLLAGCFATVALGLIEKLYLKREVPRKTYIGILFLFLLFACFQIWEAEYEQVLQLQTKLAVKSSASPPILGNVPPAEAKPPEVVTIPSKNLTAPVSTYIQTGSILPVNNK